MTVKSRSSRPPNHKAPVLRLIPTINKPLNADCCEVARKLKKALTTAQSGATAGALIIAIDQAGEWNVDLARTSAVLITEYQNNENIFCLVEY